MLTVLRPPDLITWDPLYEAWNFYRVDLIHILKKQDEERCNQKPSDGSWSICEVGDHLRVSQSLYAHLLALVKAGKQGEHKEGLVVDYDSIEQNYSGPGLLENPEAVNPAENIKKKELQDLLNKAMEKTEKNLSGFSMEELRAMHFEHPLFGMISMLDWLWVLTLHEGMHVEALKKKLIHLGNDISKKMIVEPYNGNSDSFY